MLKDEPDRGYPTDYLLSRLKGRRVRLIADWEPLVYGSAALGQVSPLEERLSPGSASSAVIWGHLLREYQWVFGQMNEGLRGVFAPFFLYTELKTIFRGLRFMEAKEMAALERVLALTLLSDTVTRALRESKSVQVAVERLSVLFSTLSSEFGGIAELFSKEGLKGMEERIAVCYLEYLNEVGLNPLIKTFFNRLVDARNIMGLYKQMRWDLSTPLVAIRGGTISGSELNEVNEHGDMQGVTDLVKRVWGKTVGKGDLSALETTLYSAMTAFLRREGRELSGVGLILDYLWRCSVEARNLSVLFHGRVMEPEIIRSEIVG